LWNEFLNYRHGTGHGVGSFLCVHEGPHRISQASSGVALLPGMVVSNEPGLYIDGSHGIRIENLCLVSEIDQAAAKNSEFGPFYQFEDLTLVPYCKKLIEMDLLSPEDKQQLKAYYQRIVEKVVPRLSDELSAWTLNEMAIF
jgi:Xaa-Pro aminopeptidase